MPLLKNEDVKKDIILDTGFTGHLCLSITTTVSLGLELTGLERVELADGTILEDEPIFSGRMEWNGGIVDVDYCADKISGCVVRNRSAKRNGCKIELFNKRKVHKKK